MALIENHYHIHIPGGLVECALDLLKQQAVEIKAIMALLEEIKALLVEQKAVITEVADDLAELVGKLEGGLSGADAQLVFDQLKENVAKLKEVAAVVPEPEPPVEE